MKLNRRKKANVDEENPYWMSFSDIMSGLLIIFILASVALIVQLMEVQEKLEAKQEAFSEQIKDLQHAEEVRRNILEEAAKELRNKGIEVTVSENDTVLSIPNEILGFGSGKYNIGPQYEETASEIGLVLNDVIRRGDRLHYLDTIFVEGHTDDRAFSGFQGKGNWGLSAFRAISLWQHWSKKLDNNPQLDKLKNAHGKPLFSVSGYGATRPVIKNQSTELDYRQNRRINIRFTIRRPSSKEYEEIQENYKSTSK